MPSIPQSLLWISLVVLWLFVLVPMLISKRDAVRRTSDVALATRVLNSGMAARLLKRGGPAAGHRSNPEWQPDEDEHGDLEDLDDLDSDDTEEMPQSGGVVVTVAAAVAATGSRLIVVTVVDVVATGAAPPVVARYSRTASDSVTGLVLPSPRTNANPSPTRTTAMMMTLRRRFTRPPSRRRRVGRRHRPMRAAGPAR